MSKRVVCEWCGHSKSIAKDVDKAYAKGRADAIDELLKSITDNSYKIEEDYTVGEFARVCIWEDDLQKIAEQLKEQKND